MYSANSVPGFLSVDCLNALICPLFEKLRKPALDLLISVSDVLQNLGNRLIRINFQKSFFIKETLIDLFCNTVDDVI